MRINCLIITALLFLTLAHLLTPATAPCLENPEQQVKFRKIDECLARGDNQQALQLLKEAEKDNLEPAESLWRMARLHYEMGRLNDEQAPDLFRKAEEYARSAILADANSSDSYKWLATALGAQTKDSDTKEKVHQSREIKESIEKAITLNPEDDTSYLVLSRWHYKVSGLGMVARAFARVVYGGIPEASLDKAEELLLHAIKLHDRVAHRYNLAKVYIRMGRKEDAREQLEKALLLPVTFPEEIREKEKARKKLLN